MADESRPYAAGSQRYIIWSDEFLLFDPFGYYIPKTISSNKSNPNFVFMEDYPINDSKWERNTLDIVDELEK